MLRDFFCAKVSCAYKRLRFHMNRPLSSLLFVVLLSEGVCRWRGLSSATGTHSFTSRSATCQAVPEQWSLLVPGHSGEQKCLNSNSGMQPACGLCGFSWEGVHIPVRFSWLVRSCAFWASFLSGKRCVCRAVSSLQATDRRTAFLRIGTETKLVPHYGKGPPFPYARA